MRTRTKKAEPKVEPMKTEPPKVESETNEKPAKAARSDPAAPSPEKNLVVFFGVDFAVERTDSLNWTAKQRRAIDTSHHLARSGGGHRWEVVGYFSSPGSSFRKIAALMMDRPEAIEARELAKRLDAIFEKFEPAVFDAMRSKTLADAAENFDGDTRAKLEAMAKTFADRACKVGES